MSTTCSVPGCEGPVYVRGFCNAHYKRWHRIGDGVSFAADTTTPRT